MEQRPLRIAMLCPYLPPIYSGAGQQALRIGTALKSKGHNVFFVTASHSVESKHQLLNGVDTFYSRIERMSSYRGQIMFGLKSLIVLFKKRKEFDILFSPGMGAMLGFLYFSLKIFDKKIILRMSVFTDDPGIIKKRKISSYLLLPYKLADCIIAPSTARLNGVVNNLPNHGHKVTRINNCVNTKHFSPCVSSISKNELLRKLQLQTDQKYVIFVGRIIARKGVDFLVDVWREVIQQYSNATLLFVGPYDFASKGINKTDPVMQKLQVKINNYNLDKKIIFTGQVDNVSDYLKVSDVFVFASEAEGLPSAPIEAMSSGVPPVVLDIEDIMPDIIDSEENGIIVASKDAEAFSNSILKLLTDEQYSEQMSINARQKICANFSINVVTEKYEQLFRALICK
ncbi:MAG: glycosyltransferase family 4 protein [Candidatus Polarisedimenticolaceae bacterium]|nr:glycosyltransferase family 4 protein [Candidatus Polarisedimenticolaceae bacterium]